MGMMTKKDAKESRRIIQDLKLNLLLEITKAINHNLSTEDLLAIYEDFLKNQLKIGQLILYVNDNGWKRLLKYGVVEDFKDIDVEKELLHISEISTFDLFANSSGEAFEIIIPVFHKTHPLAYVLIGDLEEKIEMSPTIKHLPFIQTLTNIIVVAIENKKLAKESVRQAALKKELEMASEMQAMLFPGELPKNEKVDVAAFYLPHDQVGGDYYDYIRLNEKEFIFCMADVSGKGMSAALLMSNFQANLRALSSTSISLSDLVKILNLKVMASAKGEKFITFFIGRYNIETRILTYVNAAHNPPILLNGKSLSHLKTGSTGLGMFDELEKVNEGIVEIKPGSTLVCYTDGLVELENEHLQDFNIDLLSDLIVKNLHLNSNELNHFIIGEAIKFKGSKPYIDDIALLTCRIF